MMIEDQQPLLQVRGLSKFFPIQRGLFNRVVGQVRAVDRVDFTLRSGECLGLVGESGSGKTTIGRAILRAISPSAGEVLFRVDGETVDLAIAPHAQLLGLRRHLQLIFQDPYSSLNPRMTVAEIVGEPLLIHGLRNRREREVRVRALLQQVGLQEQYVNWYPHAFSGGQRQRIGIARALALSPRLIIADEPVSALDISMQAQVLNLLRDLQQRLELTYLFISHDLGVVRYIANRVAVIYLGRIVEMAATEDIFHTPAHPYTVALLAAMPVLDATTIRRPLITGEPADPSHVPSGCAFHPRCRFAREICASEPPELREISPGHTVSCHFA
jgi:peptide/nickel transport system ATP-binding protein